MLPTDRSPKCPLLSQYNGFHDKRHIEALHGGMKKDNRRIRCAKTTRLDARSSSRVEPLLFVIALKGLPTVAQGKAMQVFAHRRRPGINVAGIIGRADSAGLRAPVRIHSREGVLTILAVSRRQVHFFV